MKKVEFIISYGMPFSGTTVFAKALAQAIDAGILNSRAEGAWEVMHVKPEQADELIDRRWNPKTELVDGELIDYWLSLAESLNKQYVVEKSPPLMFHREALKKHIPEMRELVMVRDPVQLYLSSRRRQKVDGRRLRTKAQQLEKTTRNWTVNWFNSYFKRLQKLTEILSDGVELVVYEDFVQDPDGYISNLSTLKDIPRKSVADVIEVKKTEVEKIEKRDKVPEEWLSEWELEYIQTTLLGNAVYRNLYQKTQALQA